jgi:hypothetical protein
MLVQGIINSINGEGQGASVQIFSPHRATRQDRERVMQIQGHKCANPYCNTDLRMCTPHWDHIVPRSKGGDDSAANLQWLCETCNLNKSDMDWYEFLFRYATGMGQNPNVNMGPPTQWLMTRAMNGLLPAGLPGMNQESPTNHSPVVSGSVVNMRNEPVQAMSQPVVSEPVMDLTDKRDGWVDRWISQHPGIAVTAVLSVFVLFLAISSLFG